MTSAYWARTDLVDDLDGVAPMVGRLRPGVSSRRLQTNAGSFIIARKARCAGLHALVAGTDTCNTSGLTLTSPAADSARSILPVPIASRRSKALGTLAGRSGAVC